MAPVTAVLRDQLKARQLLGPLFANNNANFLDYTNWRSRNWKSILLEAGIAYRGHMLAGTRMPLGWYNTVTIRCTWPDRWGTAVRR
jgi:hypothetical protein